MMRGNDSLLPVFANNGFEIAYLADTIPHGSVATKRRHENKKLIAAVLSFPFPFGFLGLHRIYLGTKPYMPFVYAGTVGGCFGILPLIDFITILTTKKEKIKHFENNRKVFMWLH